jgi:hypothetical protein
VPRSAESCVLRACGALRCGEGGGGDGKELYRWVGIGRWVGGVFCARALDTFLLVEMGTGGMLNCWCGSVAAVSLQEMAGRKKVEDDYETCCCCSGECLEYRRSAPALRVLFPVTALCIGPIPSDSRTFWNHSARVSSPSK